MVNEWFQDYTGNAIEKWDTTIGEYRVSVNSVITNASPTGADHWAYTIRHPNGLYVCGNSFPWSLERVKNYVVLWLAMKAISLVLTGDRDRLVNENGLDRV
jgi:hypothetical protein